MMKIDTLTRKFVLMICFAITFYLLGWVTDSVVTSFTALNYFRVSLSLISSLGFLYLATRIIFYDLLPRKSKGLRIIVGVIYTPLFMYCLILGLVISVSLRDLEITSKRYDQNESDITVRDTIIYRDPVDPNNLKRGWDTFQEKPIFSLNFLHWRKVVCRGILDAKVKVIDDKHIDCGSSTEELPL